MSAHRILKSDCTDEQADLCRRWTHIPNLRIWLPSGLPNISDIINARNQKIISLFFITFSYPVDLEIKKAPLPEGKLGLCSCSSGNSF